MTSTNTAEIDQPTDTDPRRKAKHLYWTGLRIARISEMLDIKDATLHSWKARDKWDDATSIERVEGTLESQMIQLIIKPNKDGKDFKEIDLLGRQVERFARVRRYSEPGGNETDLNPKVANRNSGTKKKQVKNQYSEEQAEMLREAFLDGLFEYQKEWYRAGLVQKVRNILKSRQIGATFYFAREALLDAVENGINQIFLSASKAQAYSFKQYIVEFASEVADIELTGDPIVLPNGATLYFLGTNAKTAQGRHGNLIFDEYFWTHNFEELRKVASGMSLQKQYRETYCSTPSSISHQAYPFYSGDHFNKGRKKADKITFDLSHAMLVDGHLGPDGQWRNMVTIEDAIRKGCDLFDLESVKLRYNEDEQRNLLMCEFVDDQQSIFPMKLIQPCMVDSWEVWDKFYKPFAIRPVGQRSVWVGYDPNGESEGGDAAGLVVILPGLNKNDKHRIVEKHQFQGLDYEEQAAKIEDICQRYNVEHIGIDITGLGAAVAQLVRKFFPAVREYRYSPEVKVALVTKTHQIISKGRLEFDAGWTDMASAFMAIRKSTTTSGTKMTYMAGRNGKTGHADLAWAAMHALDKDPLDGDIEATESIMEIY
jgi:uncharacterized protein YjcR